MKKFIVLFLGVLLITTFSYGQELVDSIQDDHDSHIYQKSCGPYFPVVAGVASLFVPGLGQIVSGEFGRGLFFLGGFLGCFSIYAVGSVLDGAGIGGSGLMRVGEGGAAVVAIWSSVDAVILAKRKNHALREQHTATISLKLEPLLMNTSFMNNPNIFSTGLTLTMSF